MSNTGIRTAGAVIIIAAGLACAPARVLAEDARVVIRLYDTTPDDREARRAAMRESAAIFGQAGVTIEWRDCSRDGTAYPCRTVRNAGDLVVRIMPTGKSTDMSTGRLKAAPATAAVSGVEGDDTPDAQLGFAAVDTTGRANVMATIYRDRVLAVTRRTGLDYGGLLGRAIAHEIGHLLLQVPGHGRSGLMRGLWTDTELLQNHHEDWTFTKSEGRQMQSRLLGLDRAEERTAAAAPPGPSDSEATGR